MEIRIFNTYEGRYNLLSDEVMDIISRYDNNDIDIRFELEQILLSLPRLSENTINTEDVTNAFQQYRKEVNING